MAAILPHTCSKCDREFLVTQGGLCAACGKEFCLAHLRKVKMDNQTTFLCEKCRIKLGKPLYK
jgi:DNA-directed RNA polymerase subunit RPC12/RpoP